MKLRHIIGWGMGMLALAVGAGCDTVEPGDEARLVVEAFFDAGTPLGPLTLRQTTPLDVLFDPGAGPPVADATVTLALDGRTVAYRPLPEVPGQYAPAEPGLVVMPGAAFALDVVWQHQRATADGVVPPPIGLDSVRLHVPVRPVQAILLDSLDLGLDSLNVGAREGFLYPIEVTLWWHVGFAEAGADSSYWVQAQLRPRNPFSSSLLDFFLLPEAILRERTLARDGRGARSWTGVYAVPVEAEATPLPPHELNVALLRSGPDYARYAASRDAPQRREPVSNVTGGVGIVAGISVDSIRVRVGVPGLR